MLLCPLGGALVHVGFPYALSRVGSRSGWAGQRPGARNRPGLLPVAAGAGLVTWAVAAHFGAAPHGWPVPLRPAPELKEYLATTGPYRFSRNPMYLGEVAMWVGWAVFYGSIAVAVGTLVFGAGAVTLVRKEERVLEGRFGDAYRAYTARVPRWLGIRH